MGSSLVGVVLCLGCTSMLGIDGEYVDEESSVSAAGHHASGGQGGRAGGASGGTSAEAGSGGQESGGNGGSLGGAGPSVGCGATAGDCLSGQKCCTGVNGVDTFCTFPEPSVGCSLDTCDRCPAPPDNATAVCNGDQCDIECAGNFIRVGDACEPAGTGGASGGGSGAGGARPTCDPKRCPSMPVGCSIASPFACCRNDQTCGCSWATTGTASAYCL